MPSRLKNIEDQFLKHKSAILQDIAAQNISREERIARADQRILDKQEDLKIDINIEE